MSGKRLRSGQKSGLTPAEWDTGQLVIKFDGNDPIAGYYPDEYVQLALVGRGQDPKETGAFVPTWA